MPFSAAAERRLKGAHPHLIKLFREVDRRWPGTFTILDSQRGKAAQEKAFDLGNSRAHFGQSAHNWDPAIALDVVPLPINWTKLEPFRLLGGRVKKVAAEMKIPIQWGGEWTTLRDYPHYELKPWRTWAAKSKPFKG